MSTLPPGTNRDYYYSASRGNSYHSQSWATHSLVTRAWLAQSSTDLPSTSPCHCCRELQSAGLSTRRWLKARKELLSILTGSPKVEKKTRSA